MPKSITDVICYFAAVDAGASVALQQVLNAKLRTELGSPWWAGFSSYAVGMTAMLVAVIVFREPRLSADMVARTFWPSWTGGIFGAVFVATAILTVPRLGAATVLALIVVGQMAGSLTFDAVGLLGVPEQPATPVRLMGAALLVIGVVLVRR